MIPDLNHLVRLNQSQVKPAAEMLARAFQDDPLVVYFFPDAAERKNKSPHFFQILVRYGVLYGEAYAISQNLEGVAVWLPSEKANRPFWGMIRSGVLSMLPKIGKGVLGRLWRCNKCAASVHRRHAPFRHWLLEPIGVDPVFQGRGYAGILLKAMLARMDEEHLPCYLDTQTEKNVAIYQHYGFKVVEEFAIPGTGFSNWAMLRKRSG